MNTTYLNGDYVDLADAKVSVMDRGFLFGDGVYEVVPVYARQPFRLQEHLQRLSNSLAATQMANPHTDAEWKTVIERIIAGCPSEDQQVYLQVTRGVGPVRNHAFPVGVAPSVLVMTEPLLPPPAAWAIDGVSAVSAADIRWLRCNIKATSLLANCLLRQMAVAEGCVETVLYRDGVLTEGAASNIFAVKDGVLLAPQKNHLMLPGITYDIVLEIAVNAAIPVKVADITQAEVMAADELLMTSSTREIQAIVQLDGRPIGTGKPGPMAARLAALYQTFKAVQMRGKH